MTLIWEIHNLAVRIVVVHLNLLIDLLDEWDATDIISNTMDEYDIVDGVDQS